jgi:hypothetical protein
MRLLKNKYLCTKYVTLSEVPTLSSTLLRSAQTDGRNAVEVRRRFASVDFRRDGQRGASMWIWWG